MVEHIPHFPGKELRSLKKKEKNHDLCRRMAILREFPIVPTIRVKRVRTPDMKYLGFSMVFVCSCLPQVACIFSEMVERLLGRIAVNVGIVAATKLISKAKLLVNPK